MDSFASNNRSTPPPLSSFEQTSFFEAADDQPWLEMFSPYSAEHNTVSSTPPSRPGLLGDYLESEAILNGEHSTPSPSAFLLGRPSDAASQRRPSKSLQHRSSLSPRPCFDNDRHNSLFNSPDPNLFVSNNSPTPLVSSHESGFVDLTDSPPIVSRSRMADTHHSTKTSSCKTIPAGTIKRQRETPPQESETKRLRIDFKDVEEVDLRDVEDDEDYASFSKRTKEEAVKQKQVDEANKPVKLSEFQCIICLDNPTDLTVTWCGKLTSCIRINAHD